jgi:bifunctional non-homologous end joining protein LigD
MKLQKYRSKRDFSVTSEPSGADWQTTASRPKTFVIQKHHASRLHYDFRLEIDGVLKSWAVPKGPSLNPSTRRLAVQTEDHPLEYANFEGIIPAGQYGAGKVIIWDRGTWSHESDDDGSVGIGRLEFTLHGQRLNGKWNLVRTQSKESPSQWLMIKVDDEYADTKSEVTTKYTTSIVSGLEIDQLETRLPSFIEPKLPTLVTDSPSGDLWIHELKLDGYRMQAHWNSGNFRLLTRSGKDWANRYAVVSEMLADLNFDATIIDGELVALDAHGRSDFSALQAFANEDASTLAFFAFDLLFLNGADVRHLPLLHRKAKLASLLEREEVKAATRIQYLDHLIGDPKPLRQQCENLSLEGVVSKRHDRPYISGRGPDWVKVKNRFREHFVVAGYEMDQSDNLSSLLVGVYEDSRLIFAGRVGTGWDQATGASLIRELAAGKQRSKPFAGDVPPSSKRGSAKLAWTEPKLVVTVDFAGWTDRDLLRQAAFRRIEEGLPVDHVNRPDCQTLASNLAEMGQIDVKGDKKDEAASAPHFAINLASGVTSPNRVLFPDDAITKTDLVAYLYQVGQWMLPHLKNRPLSLVRCPNGIGSESYFQRHPQPGLPNEISRIPGEDQESLLSVDSLPGLLATAQISAIELHPWNCRKDNMHKPDQIVVDLDPDPSMVWSIVVDAALRVRDFLTRCSLKAFVKTTGGKGLHIVVPISRRYGWKRSFEFTKSLAESLEQQHPSLFVSSMAKVKRKRKVYLDYHRNRRGATAVAPYSIRARTSAPVSTPVSWSELPNVVPDLFTIKSVPERLRRLSHDPWEGMLRLRQSLPR